ncbi:MAG: hypothetical protein ACYDA3_05135 [Gaiellaceae bacterium]
MSEHVTIDFAFLDPGDAGIGFVVARVTVPSSGIIELAPENKPILRRRLERAEAYRRAKFPEYYKDKD